MEEAVAEKTKQKRVRKAPYRKWSDQEQRQLITFLRSNVPIEKTTAQLYYKRFLNDMGIELEWALVRCKAKNLRQIYTKAKAWTNSTGAGTMRDGETTRDVILRMCPAFDELEEIFGYKEYTVNACVVDTEDDNTLGPISDEDTIRPSWLVDASATQLDTPATSAQTPATSAQTPATSAQTPRGPTRKGIYSRTALSDVLEVHSSLVENRKAKLKVDKEFREKEFQLKREQLDFEKEKHLSREKFKKLELEMKERIALREIESRERVEMQKLKMIP